MILAQSVRRGADILAEGDTSIACVDRAGVTPRRLPDEMRARLSQLQ